MAVVDTHICLFASLSTGGSDSSDEGSSPAPAAGKKHRRTPHAGKSHKSKSSKRKHKKESKSDKKERRS